MNPFQALPSLHWLWTLLDVAMALAASVHIVFHKRQPRSATIWVLLVWLLPLAGFLLYWYFGYNRVVNKVSPEHPLLLRTPPKDGAGRPGQGPWAGLQRLGQGLTGHPLLGGHRLRLLRDGAQAYPEMLKAIARARRSIHLSTYIFDMDPVGQRFVEALKAAARRGVEVYVLVDGVGAWLPLGRLRRVFKGSGVRFAPFWSSESLFHQPLINLRNHRKILVVDGQLGFTGGLNISERYHKGAIPRSLWRALRPKGSHRDLHLEVSGPAVAGMDARFCADWALATGQLLPAAAAGKAPRAGARARVVSSGPDQSTQAIYELLIGALHRARREVWLCTPYFIPDTALLGALRSAAYAGVTVHLLLPRRSDHRFMGWASRAYFWELLEAGVQLWRIEGGFVHSKAVVVDNEWCLLGSCNLDPRSFRLNFEMNLEAYDAGLARQLLAVLRGYQAQARRLGLPELKRLGFWPSLRDHVVKLFSPYL